MIMAKIAAALILYFPVAILMAIAVGRSLKERA